MKFMNILYEFLIFTKFLRQITYQQETVFEKFEKSNSSYWVPESQVVFPACTIKEPIELLNKDGWVKNTKEKMENHEYIMIRSSIEY